MTFIYSTAKLLEITLFNWKAADKYTI